MFIKSWCPKDSATGFQEKPILAQTFLKTRKKSPGLLHQVFLTVFEKATKSVLDEIRISLHLLLEDFPEDLLFFFPTHWIYFYCNAITEKCSFKVLRLIVSLFCM